MRGLPGAMARGGILLAAWMLLAAHGRGIAAEGASPAGVRPGVFAARAEDHTNFGRIDIESGSAARYRIERDGDIVSIRFEPGTKLSPPDRLPRNVLAARVDGAILDLTLVHGAAIHPLRSPGHVDFDIYDVPAPARPTPAAPIGTAPATPEPRAPEPRALGPGAPEQRAVGPGALGPGAPEPRALGPGAVGPGALGPMVAAAPRTPVKRETGAVPPPNPARALADVSLALSPELGGRLARPPAAQHAAGPASPAAPAASPVPEQAAAGGPVPPRAGDGAGAPAADTAPVALPADEKAAATGRDVLPGPEPQADLIARRVRLPPEVEGNAILLPFDAATGAAAFRSGETTYVVMDQRRPVSLLLLRDDPVFRVLTMRLLPAATLFQVDLPPDRHLALARVPQGWRLLALPAAARRQAILPVPEAGHIALAADLPGSVIGLADPDTGATLLVGTQRRPGQAITVRRRTGQFILRQTIQGVVLEPLADTIQMQTTRQGFSLSGSAGPLAVSPVTPAMQASIAAAQLTRTLDLPMLRPGTLFRRLEGQLLEAGGTPPLSRGPPHRAAAETLVSLGFAAEADSLLRAMAAQDPREASKPATEALMGMTALLAGRPNDADPLNDKRLDGTDEIDFWRAVRMAMADEGSPAAAAVFATTGALITAYPPPVAEHFLPLVVETMLLGGEIQPAARLMDARPGDPKLAYARALRREADGDTDGALGMLDQLAGGRDQFDSLRGAVHAIELRLKTGRIDETQAADGLNKLLIAWRGDDRELALRERVAALRAKTGAWRTGLTMLRDAERDFPEHQPAIRARLQDMFGAMMRDSGAQGIPPLDFVSMVDENLDLMPRYDNDPTVQQALLDRLIALDLPDRAMPLLRKLLRGAVSDIAKARYGATLAAMQNHEGDSAGALATLDATETDKAPDNLAEDRILTRASAMAHGGDRPGAITLLTRLATAAASARRAELQEEISDWTAAEAAWRDSLAATTVPDAGTIGAPATHTLVRLAAAAARAGDDAGLQTLRATWLDRLPAGPDADAFRLLTADSVRSAADLGRSAEDVRLAASVAAGSKTEVK